MSDQPTWVCSDCGRLYGNGWPEGHVGTFHTGDKCGVCGRETWTTEPRDYRWLKPEWKRHNSTVSLSDGVKD